MPVSANGLGISRVFIMFLIITISIDSHSPTIQGLISPSCKFPKLCICQKLWKLVGSRQSYCSNKQAYYFLSHPVYTVRHMIWYKVTNQ